MITTRTRILSILATVAMLVSMLACFVIPASAAAVSDYVEVWNDIDNPTVNAPALSALIDENGVKDTGTSVADLKTAAATDASKIVWKTFHYKDNPFPRFALHEAYEAAGYTKAIGKVDWSIHQKADWDAMDTVAKGAAADYPDYVDADGNYFSGITFHLYEDVNFGNTKMSPLGAYDGRNFSGTINGHGNGFKNINIQATSKVTGYYGGNATTGSIGLIAFLGSCIIQDFGIYSGTVNAQTGKHGSVSTFGCVAQNLTTPPAFTRVWSGVKLSAPSTTNGSYVHMSALAGVHTNVASAVKVNGFIFYGEINKLKSSTNYDVAYGVYGNSQNPVCDGSEFYNIITYPKDTSAASLSTFLFHYSAARVFKNAVDNGTISNVYGKQLDSNKEGGSNTYREGSSSGKTAGSVDKNSGDGFYNLLTSMSKEESAWTINKNPTATDLVFFSFKEVDGNDVIIPVATDDEAITKLTVNGSAEYINNGTTFTKAELAAKAGVNVAAITGMTVSVNGGEATSIMGQDSYTLNAMTTDITITYSNVGALTAAWGKYSGMDAKHLTNASYTKWQEVQGLVNSATEDTALGLVDQVNALKDELEIIDTYDAPEGKELPGFSKYEVYKDFKTTNNWAIRTKEDWFAMNDYATAEDTPNNYFVGYTFHLYDDVDFDATPNDDESDKGDEMLPLGAKDGRNFSGTINGHGYGFKNIFIEVVDVVDGYYGGSKANGSIGLIAFLGSCSIQDFGVHSGTIAASTAAHGSVSTFGCVAASLTTPPAFTRVWSGVKLVSPNDSDYPHISALAGTYNNSTASAIKVNGFVFDGTIQKGKSRNGYDVGYGVYGGTKAQPCDNSEFYNIISYPKNNSSITLPIFLFQFTNEAAFKTAMTGNKIKNVYGLTKNDETKVGIDNTYRYGTSATPTAGSIDNTAGDGAYNLLTSMSNKKTAWTINNSQTVTGQETVYFTLKGSKVRPTADATNRIVQYTATINDEEAQYYYANAGEAVDVKKLVGADKYENATVTVTVGGNTVDPVDGKYEITGDAIVVVTGETEETKIAAAIATLDAELSKYTALLDAHLKTTAEIATDGKIGLPEFRVQVQAAKDANDLAQLQAAVDVITGNNLVVEVSADYNKAPGYKDHADYEAYNAAKIWAVRTPADWLEMVAASNAETDPETFEGCTIHVLADIDFADETDPMKPLNYCNGLSTDETAPFRGTLEGHDHVFKNIKIEETLTSETNAETGAPTQEHVVALIGQLGNGAVINNFGVESGTIKATGTSKLIYLSTFGKVFGGRTVTLNKVWSGVTLVSESESPSIAVGIVGPGARSSLTINGAYFCGTLNAKRAVGLFHQLYSETLYNVLAAPTVVGSPSADAMFMKHSDATDGYTVINAFSVGKNIYSGFDGTDTNITNADVVGSALEGAWRINSANLAGEAATGVGKVYFTKVGDAVRFGEESNRIVQFTGTLNDNQEVRYANVGNAVDVKALFGLKTAPNVSMKVYVGGEEVPEISDGIYNISGNATVVATFDATDAWIARLQAKIAEYNGLDTGYFKTADELAADEIGLADFIARSNEAISARDADKLRTLTTALKNNKLVVEITTNYLNVPAFKLHTTYMKYNKDLNWLIEDPADWQAMDDVAKLTEIPNEFKNGEYGDYFYVTERTDEETGKVRRRERYFVGATFHLKHDVNFENAERLPLGARDMRAFCATIDGHGYGFSNINILVDKDDITDTYYTYDTEGTMNGSIGLIGFLGRGAHLKDFGINSGSIIAGTGGNAGSVSSFGCIFENYPTTPVSFTRVWSGADLLCKDKARKNVYLNALVGSFNGKAGAVGVNGFVFSGTMGKQQGGSDMAFGIYGGNRNGPAKNGTFANIVSFPIVSVGIQTYLFGFGSDDNYTNTAANISNVYGVKKNDTSKKVGMVYDYRNTDVQFGYDADGNVTNVGGIVTDPTYLAATSGKEAAWMSNVNQTAGENAVYFTLTESGDIRPVASDQYEIIKVTVNGSDGFVNKGYEMDLGNLAAKAGVKTRNIDTITVKVPGQEDRVLQNTNGDITDELTFTLTDDTEFVVVSSCKHLTNTNEDYTPTIIEGERMHEKLCTECGDRIGDAAPCELTITADEVDLDNGHSSHTITCSVCGRDDLEECNGVRYTNRDDCTQDDIWEFDCGIEGHTGEFFVTGGDSQFEEHDFTGVEWQYVAGSTTKQVRKCNNCNTLLYRIFGTISVTDVITPDVGEPAEITIILPSGLLSADLEFIIDGVGYTITNVVGATPEDKIYKVNGTTTVTVTVSASTASRGGTFKVEMTNAIAREENTTFDKASATTTIEFAGILGDADNNYEITLKDALDTLYVVVGKTTPANFNVKNANVVDPTENPVESDITIADVRGIIVLWLKKTIEEV